MRTRIGLALATALLAGCNSGVVAVVDAASQGSSGNPPVLSAVLGEGLIVANGDGRGGIPLPFTVFDADGRKVELVFQWTRPGEAFPPLPKDPAALRALLTDPLRRRELQIASELPVATGGRVLSATSDTARLPELASSAAGLLAGGLVGRELEILRSTSTPVPVAATWAVNPLQEPVAALPLAAGSALVLDRPVSGTWRLARIDLATGAQAIVAESAGDPGALALETGGGSALVACDRAGIWRLERVNLASGRVDFLVDATAGATELGTVRGLASLGRTAALLTVGNSLVRASYPQPGPPRAIALVGGLQTPWGVVLDPLATHRAYVAERDAPVGARNGRVVAIDLVTRALQPLRAEFVRPQSLALERSGARLLALTDAVPGDGRLELAAVDLGGQGNEAFEIAVLPAAEVRSLATGRDGLRLLALSDVNDLAVGGGVEQRRTIVSYASARQTVAVERPFEPPLAALAPWRILRGTRSVVARRTGTRGVFVWDSSDLDGGGEVLFRVLPFNLRVGVEGTSGSPHVVRPPFDETQDPVRLPVMFVPVAGAAADLDGDGDLDLVSANEGPPASLTIFVQTGPGVFAPGQTLGSSSMPAGVVVRDLDGDGDLDLVSANKGSGNLSAFFQTSPGAFNPTPLVLGNATITGGAASVAAADLDGDGWLDLVSANSRKHTLTIFFQTGFGTFDPVPTVLGGPGTSDGAISVVAADLDGDGDLDLVSANSTGNNLTLFFQTSQGVFDPTPKLLGSPETTEIPNSIAAADLDGDGDLDLVSANLGRPFGPMDSEASEFGSNLTLFFQQSPGVFDPVPTILGNITITPDPSSVTAADLDGDGDLDLAVTVQSLDLVATRSNLAFYFQTSPGVFRALPQELGGTDTTGSPAALITADLNADGSLDLVSFNSGKNFLSPPGTGNDLTIFFGNRGTLDLRAKPSGLGEPVEDVEAADLDRDGDLDLLAVGGSVLSAVPLLPQRGPGVFDPVLELGGLSQGLSETLADLDGDGNPDIAIAAHDTVLEEPFLQSGVKVYFQTSPGAFAAQTTLRTEPPAGVISSLPDDLVAADLDGDGDRELIVATWLSGQLSIFFQTNPGDFDPAPLTLHADNWKEAEPVANLLNLRGTGPSSVVAADLDGDGDLDLASENGTTRPFSIPLTPRGGDVTLFFQTAPGVLGPTPTVIGASSQRTGGEIDVADLDGDGDLDLFTANGFANDLTLFFQTAPGLFAPAPSRVLGDASTLNRPISITAGDLDGDGDLDVVAASSGQPFGGGVAVFRQTSPGNFAAQPVALVDPAIRMPLIVRAIDLDGDGQQDLILGDSFFGVTIFYSGH